MLQVVPRVERGRAVQRRGRALLPAARLSGHPGRAGRHPAARARSRRRPGADPAGAAGLDPGLRRHAPRPAATPAASIPLADRAAQHGHPARPGPHRTDRRPRRPSTSASMRLLVRPVGEVKGAADGRPLTTFARSRSNCRAAIRSRSAASRSSASGGSCGSRSRATTRSPASRSRRKSAMASSPPNPKSSCIPGNLTCATTGSTSVSARSTTTRHANSSSTPGGWWFPRGSAAGDAELLALLGDGALVEEDLPTGRRATPPDG